MTCSHLGIAHLLYPQLEGKKPTALLVPEPRNCAKMQAKVCQEKQSAVVRVLRQSRPVTVEERLLEGPLVSRRRSWNLLCGKCGFSLVMDSSCYLQILRDGDLCGVCKRDLPRGVWDICSQDHPVVYQPDCLEVQAHGPLGDGGL